MKTHQIKKRKYSLNLAVKHLEFLMQIVKYLGSVEKALDYLSNKYQKRIEVLANYKEGDIERYQPRGEEYINFSFLMEENKVWGILKGLKSATGLSISLLIRLMIEWEMNEEKYDEVIKTLVKIGIELREEDKITEINESEVELISISYRAYPLERKVEIGCESRMGPKRNNTSDIYKSYKIRE